MEITFQDIINKYINWLVSTCQNIGSYANGVPDSAKVGYDFNYKTQTVNNTNSGGGINIKLTSQNGIPTVTLDTINSQLSSFLSSRGILAKQDQKLTSKSLINLWNQLAIFSATKVAIVVPWDSPNRYYFYNANKNTFSSVAYQQGEEVDSSSVNDMITAIDSLAKNATLTQLKYSITAVSSCSCSSSTSSSSSTSCSSSSLFVGYVKM